MRKKTYMEIWGPKSFQLKIPNKISLSNCRKAIRLSLEIISNKRKIWGFYCHNKLKVCLGDKNKDLNKFNLSEKWTAHNFYFYDESCSRNKWRWWEKWNLVQMKSSAGL